MEIAITDTMVKKFNTDPVVWDDFNKTSFNPLVLVKLIDDWLMHLKSPVLRMQDLHSLQQNPLFQEDILTSLEIFEKINLNTIQNEVRFVKSDCTLIESVDTLSKFLSISQ
ncbi:unnamed protein product [Schistosoma turkestanicum]|nr:unnamed protein product [Schistosoma turkestanicum]